jgi:hypothetical protein
VYDCGNVKVTVFVPLRQSKEVCLRVEKGEMMR